jgi:WD40 repeat protein
MMFTTDSPLKNALCWTVRLLTVLLSLQLLSGTAFAAPSQTTVGVDTLTMVRSLAASPDGRIVATGGLESLRIWDLASGRMIREIGSRWSVESITFSKDGKLVVYGDFGGKIRFYNLEEGRLTKTINFGGAVRAVIFSPDGRYLAAAGWPSRTPTTADERLDGVRVWDMATGALVAFYPVEDAHALAFAAGSSKLLVAGKRLKLFDIKSAKPLSDIDTAARAIAIKSDGSAAVTGDESGIIRIWDLNTGQVIKQFSEPTRLVNALTFWQDEKSIVAVGGEIGVYDVSSSLVRSFPHPWGINAPSSMAMLPNGRVVTNGSDIRELFVWNLQSGKAVQHIVGSTGVVRGLNFAPNSNTIFATRDDSTLTEWRLDSGSVESISGSIKKYVQSLGQVSISPDGASALLSNFDGDTSLIQVLPKLGADRQPIATPSVRPAVNGIRETLQLSPKGSVAAFSKSDGTVNFVDVPSGSLSSITAHPPNPEPCCYTSPLIRYSPDGTFIYSAGSDGTIKKWNTADHSLNWSASAHRARIKEFAVSADGRTVLSSATDNTLKISDALTGRMLHEFGGELARAENLSFVPNSNLIAGVLANDVDNTEEIRLWDVTTGQPVKSLGKVNPVTELAVSKNGRYLVSGGYDTSLHLWRLDSGELLATEYSSGPGEWVVVTPEGFFDTSSPKAARFLSVVRGLDVSSIDQVYNALYRPDLVREKLAGDPQGKVRAAAAQLDLDKVMSSGMAPRVAITSPASGSSSSTDEVAVEATIADQGGGTGKVEWRVNGVTLGLESRGLDRVGQVHTVKRTLALEPGDNRIEIVAYNAKGLIASEPAQITIKWDGAKTASPPKLYVLAVGVNDYYDSRLHLAYAVPDATALADAFKKAGTGLYASVEVETVLDSDVTLSNLDKVFADLSSKVQPRDVFVFFLAGHGKTENGRYYFLPRDFRYEDESSIQKAGMGQDKFQAWFAEIPARKSLLLYDTCESGSLTGATRGSDIDERLGALNRMARATGRTFLTATTDDAPALEGFHGHGVFTYALLDAFDHADVNHDGLIEISELADYVDQKVPDYSYQAFKLRQIPQRSIVGNNFAVTNKTEVMAAAPDGAAGEMSIPTKPTHVVIAPVDVFAEAAGKGVTNEKLPVGTLLTLMKMEQGWVLVAKDGKRLGYVAADHLVQVQ